jgi:metal-responsive CopG/Arc/MetJ family transcriptional regulator
MARKRVEKEQVNIRIAPAVLERLDEIGEPFGIRRTELVRRAIEEYVVRHEGQSGQRATTAPQPPAKWRGKA